EPDLHLRLLVEAPAAAFEDPRQRAAAAHHHLARTPRHPEPESDDENPGHDRVEHLDEGRLRVVLRRDFDVFLAQKRHELVVILRWEHRAKIRDVAPADRLWRSKPAGRSTAVERKALDRPGIDQVIKGRVRDGRLLRLTTAREELEDVEAA